MGNYNVIAEAGKNIMDAVNQAVEQNDYSRLNDDISAQITNLTEEINRYNQNRSKNSKTVSYTVTRSEDSQRKDHPRSQSNTAGSTGASRRTADRSSTYRADPYASTPFLQKKPTYSRAAVMQIIAVFGLIISLPWTFIGIIGMTVDVLVGIVLAGMGIAASYALIKLFRKGKSERRLIDEFYKYSRIVGNEEYIPVAELAEGAAESKGQVISNLRAMIKGNLLPFARLDRNQTTLMLTTEVYQQYRDALKQKKKNDRQDSRDASAEKISDSSTAYSSGDASDASLSPEVRKLLKDGQRMIDQIQKYNDDIPGEEMSRKLDDLKNIVDRIFRQVRKNPKSAGDLSRFINYYMPTTEKLLDAYAELDKQPETANIASTKREIENAIDTINSAFNNLFDKMFEDVAWDISTDISAMKTMMAQDGLTRQDLMSSSTDSPK